MSNSFASEDHRLGLLETHTGDGVSEWSRSTTGPAVDLDNSTRSWKSGTGRLKDRYGWFTTNTHRKRWCGGLVLNRYCV